MALLLATYLFAISCVHSGVSTRRPRFLLVAFGWVNGPLDSVQVGGGETAPRPGQRELYNSASSWQLGFGEVYICLEWRAASSTHRKCGIKLPEALRFFVLFVKICELNAEVAQLMGGLAHIAEVGAQLVHEHLRVQFPGRLERGVPHRDIKPANIMAAEVVAEPVRSGPHRVSRTLDRQPPFQVARHRLWVRPHKGLKGMNGNGRCQFPNDQGPHNVNCKSFNILDL